MGSKICMNSSCGTATTHEWKKGWPLRSGGYADLCYSCGSAYKNLVFCNTFHLEETGWRDCYICCKRLHCGCIASKFVLELLDYGGVACTTCAKSSQLPLIHGDGLPNGLGALTINNAGSCSIESRVVGDYVDGRRLVKMEANEHLPLQSQRGDANASFRQDRREEVDHPIRDEGASFSNPLQPCMGPPKFAQTSVLEVKDIHNSLSQPSLSMTLAAPSGNSNIMLPFSSVVADAPFRLGQRSRPILPKPSKNGPGTSTETNKSAVSQMRIARPPVEGRGKNHLLPRYWPRITDQELQQLSGDLKSTIVPLFEKVLSASDAGRIGRLVLPKTCAEAYFPSISQSEVSHHLGHFNSNFVLNCIHNMLDLPKTLYRGQEQWAQCDDCYKWRRLPVDVLLPSKWTCADNVGNSSRCSCSAPEEISPKGLENLLKADLKKRRALESHKIVEEHEPSSLDALASAAVLGEKIGNSGESSMGATTKHPRHRPGCTCIVCIQPPSGKGKHKPTCTCNVCLTVKRRFKTLMLRKKKRQSEREAEMCEKENNANKDDRQMNCTRQNVGRHEVDVVESSTGQLDLNCHPNREDMQAEEAEASIMPVGEAGTNKMALEDCEEQHKLPNSKKEQPDREDDRQLADEEFISSVGWEGDNKGEKERCREERNGLQ
ncbi:hypothetical protein SLEP1_g21073 [Rubroshorea leprosula]|uniref:CW-type domain-containing protein n=1 Tax=Rubroshorea leprosula TaxID=152421 RepID=A0AAV5JFB7_9ROSI|nr:hypothetical protein SLEP1_g21073 [Rubroshorea leprosula]